MSIERLIVLAFAVCCAGLLPATALAAGKPTPTPTPRATASPKPVAPTQVLDEPYAQAGGINRGVAFGVPSSHGCLGLDLDSATWLYSITGYGTPVDVHY